LSICVYFGRNACNADACNAVAVAGLFPKVCQVVCRYFAGCQPEILYPTILWVSDRHLVSLKLTHWAAMRPSAPCLFFYLSNAWRFYLSMGKLCSLINENIKVYILLDCTNHMNEVEWVNLHFVNIHEPSYLNCFISRGLKLYNYS
jgi:hypothetical protein